MAIIDTSIDINAPVDKVWDIISDLDNEPKFWKGLTANSQSRKK